GSLWRPAARAHHPAGGARPREGVPRSRPLLVGRRSVTKADRYGAVGVKLDTAEEAKRRIAELVRTTRTPLARGAVGGFGGRRRRCPTCTRPVITIWQARSSASSRRTWPCTAIG